MTESHGQVTREAARTYERFFVPAIFGQWAAPIADAADLAADARALDVACGTGVVTRELARRLGPSNVRGLDCNAGMLAVARDVGPDILYEQGHAEALPYDAGSFDAITCAFGLMFFADRVAALRQMWRALRPGGRLVVATWSALPTTPGYDAMVRLLARLFGDAIADELRAPFVLGDARAVAAPFEAATIPVNVATIPGRARFPSLEAWVHTDVEGWTLAGRLDAAQVARLRAEASDALSRFVDATGAVDFEAPALLAVATKL